MSSTTNANRTTTNQQQQQQQNGGNMKEKSNNNNTKSSIVSPATASNTMKTAWDLEAENDPIYDLYPRKYRCSGRIGRGGRIILDRKPVGSH